MAAPKLDLAQSDMPGVTAELETRLRQAHISLIERIDHDEGKTNYVYSANFEHQGLRKAVVVKIPKPLSESSATAYISRAHKDLTKSEIAAKNALSHPNIVETVDIIALSDGTLIPIEQRFNSTQSLQRLVATAGPIRSPKVIQELFMPQLDALEYMHDKGFAHRDIKPSNTLVDDRRHVKFTDMQMAVDRKSFPTARTSALYTKGSAPYSTPEINNAFVTGAPVSSWHAFVKNDLHGFGASLFYSLTGKTLFDYSIDFEKSGTPIDVNGDTMYVALKNSGRTISAISAEEHDKHLKAQLKLVPRRYRKLIRRLTTAGDDSYADAAPFRGEMYQAIRRDLEHATRENIDWRAIGRSSRRWVLATGITAGVIAGTAAVIKMESQREPSPYEMVSRSPYRVQDVSGDPESLGFQDLQLSPYYAKVKRIANWVDEFHPMTIANYHVVEAMSGRDNRRLDMSYIRSVAANHEAVASLASSQNRSAISFVPVEFILDVLNSGGGLIRDRHAVEEAKEYGKDELRSFGFATQMLNLCGPNKRDVADVYACVLADESEIFDAQQRAHSTSYFGFVDGQLRPHPGYSGFLPKAKRDLISTAVALYRLTDARGNIHADALDANNKPIRGLEDK